MLFSFIYLWRYIYCVYRRPCRCTLLQHVLLHMDTWPPKYPLQPFGPVHSVIRPASFPRKPETSSSTEQFLQMIEAHMLHCVLIIIEKNPNVFGQREHCFPAATAEYWSDDSSKSMFNSAFASDVLISMCSLNETFFFFFWVGCTAYE